MQCVDENDCTKDGDNQKTCGGSGSCVCKTDGYQIGKTGTCEELPGGKVSGVGLVNNPRRGFFHSQLYLKQFYQSCCPVLFCPM